jgi:hypothetical protein
MATTYFGTKVYSEADYVGGFAPGSSHLRVGEAKPQDRRNDDKEKRVQIDQGDHCSGRQLQQTSSGLSCHRGNPYEDQSYAMSPAVVASMNMLLTKVALHDNFC